MWRNGKTQSCYIRATVDGGLAPRPDSPATSRGTHPAGSVSVFDGFEAFDIQTIGTTIHGRLGGQGPPVLLLHGIPETHLMS